MDINTDYRIKLKKVCPMCGIEKERDEYYVTNGHISYFCKECTVIKSNMYRLNNTEDQKEHRKEWAKEYRQRSKRTMSHWYPEMYRRMRTRNRKKFNTELDFTLEEFIEWVNTNYKNEFPKMFNDYVNSNCNKYLRPSIDRIDDYKEYTFDNMQLLTWEDNDKKGSAGQKNKESCAKIAKEYWSKPVIQCDLNDKFIARFESTHDAERKLGIDSSSIAGVCRSQRDKDGHHNTAKGFIWHYEEDWSTDDNNKAKL